MDASVRVAVWSFYFLAGVVWLGSLVFIAYRIHQLRTLPVVDAEVIKAGTDSYVTRSYETDTDGWSQEVYHRWYAAAVVVRYEYKGKQFITEARHDVASSKWIQDRLARKWKPGTRIRIRIDPARPQEPLAGLGVNLNTFLPAFGLVACGFILVAMGYGVARLGAFLTQLFDSLPRTRR